MNLQYTEYTEAPAMQAPFDKVISSSMDVFAIFIFLFIGGLILFSWWINVKVLNAPLFELPDYGVNKGSRKPPAKVNALARS